MSAAEYWRIVCETRVTAGYPSLVSDPWCRRLLSEVAGPDHVITEMDQYWPGPVGVDGSVWRFSDGSSLWANSETTIVR